MRKEFKDKRKIFDKAVQKAKRSYLKEQQVELETLIYTNQNSFWKKMGKVGIGQERKKNIPFEILLEDGTVCRDADIVLQKWKSSFEALLNPLDADTTTSVEDKSPMSEVNTESVLNTSITREEVIKAMNAMKNNKSSGIDDLPAEVLKNSILIDLLTVLFKKYFDTGITPDIWK